MSSISHFSLDRDSNNDVMHYKTAKESFSDYFYQQSTVMESSKNIGTNNSYSNAYSDYKDIDIPKLRNNVPHFDAFLQPQSYSKNNHTYWNKSKTENQSLGFQIRNEDFPALTATGESIKSVISDTIETDKNDVITENDGILPESKQFGIKTSCNGTVSNIPANMIKDPFGIVGLLTFIRAAEHDSSLEPLVPGLELTTLGLNLNSPGDLHKNFLSPWADGPCRLLDIDYKVPTEYFTNCYIREKLAPIKFSRYSEDLLFFQFYTYVGDLIQYKAAEELFNRDWRYHKEDKIWLTRVQGVEPTFKCALYEKGTYFVFDINSWNKIPKELTVEYDKLENQLEIANCLLKN